VERGLFYQIGPLTPLRFEALAEQVSLAEALGLDRVWCLPMMDEAGGWQGGPPEIGLAGLAGVTKSIRLGWGIPGIWPPREAPVRQAEQAATLDGASGGRLDLAVLSELGVAELGDALDADAILDAAADAGGDAADEIAGSADEGIRMCVDMWAPETFSWTSARFSVPPIDVVPKPVQRPHPPLCLVGWSAAHAGGAGRAGMGYLDGSGGGHEIWSAHRECYVSARRGARAEDLVCTSAFAVAVELPEDRVTDVRGGRAARDWLEDLEAIGIDQVVFRAGPDGGGHEETCRRIRWLAGK
jgi:alkanesulfonate monooxygenase SsuD/methylene tetrahydromethanopterin reductase-like flavin-dependent oxidoreductase (luciferase family)